MKKYLSLILISITLSGKISAANGQTIKWPNNKKCAIVLTYDDALQSQLDNAVPQLEKAGLKATFFLTGDINSGTIPKWRMLSKKGFELGNHTIFHPCLATDDNPVASTNYTPYSMILEIQAMNNFLFAVDGKNTRTYAYPCAETTVGDNKDYVDTLRKYGLVKYARAGGDMNDGVITDFKHLDLLNIPSFGLEDNTPAVQLIAFVKRVQEKGGLGIIMLHGIGGDYITTSVRAHQQLINYLKANKKNIWIDTFQNTMDYVNKYLLSKNNTRQ